MYYSLCSKVPNLIVPDFFAMKVRIDLSHCSLAVIGLTLCAIVLQFHAENCKYFQKQHKSPKIHTCILSILTRNHIACIVQFQKIYCIFVMALQIGLSFNHT